MAVPCPYSKGRELRINRSPAPAQKNKTANDHWVIIGRLVRTRTILLVVSDLIVDVIFFVIQMRLLSLCNVSTVDSGITLLLPSYASIFALQLTIVAAQVPLVGINPVVNVAGAVQHLCATRVILSKRSRPTSTAG
jgi:hypothetical protein